MVNLNRVFSGNADGLPTEQPGVQNGRGILEEDRLLRGPARGRRIYPTVDYVYILNAEPLSPAFGSPLPYRPKETLADTSVCVTRRLNIPSVVVELGGGDIDQADYVWRGITDLANMLKTRQRRLR